MWGGTEDMWGGTEDMWGGTEDMWGGTEDMRGGTEDKFKQYFVALSNISSTSVRSPAFGIVLPNLFTLNGPGSY